MLRRPRQIAFAPKPDRPYKNVFFFSTIKTHFDLLSLTSCLACSCSTAVMAGCTSLTWGSPCGRIPGGSLLPKPPMCGRLPSSSSPCPSSYVKTVVNKLSALFTVRTLTHALARGNTDTVNMPECGYRASKAGAVLQHVLNFR